MRVLVKLVLYSTLLTAAVLSVNAWWLPVEIRQIQAAATVPATVPDNGYAQFEAAGFAEAMWWLVRIAAPTLFGMTCLALRRRPRVTRFIQSIWNDLTSNTLLTSKLSGRSSKIATWTFRLLIGAWFILGVSHAGSGVVQRLKDWPAYRLHAGDQTLPNISLTNREVIRYLRQATPPNTRIFVYSDQKLFFMSYYLRPRRLFHRMHPGSEFEIPQAHGANQLTAYRVGDLDSSVLNELNIDYVLEYFEGPEYIDSKRLNEDEAWYQFRSRYGQPQNQPVIFVSLRRVSSGETP